MPESANIIVEILTSFWGVLATLGLFFGVADLLKHLGNRLDKRRALEIYRELMKQRLELMDNAVQFGADEKVLAELGSQLEKHADLRQLTELSEMRVSGESEATGIRIEGLGDSLLDLADDDDDDDDDRRRSRRRERRRLERN